MLRNENWLFSRAPQRELEFPNTPWKWRYYETLLPKRIEELSCRILEIVENRQLSATSRLIRALPFLIQRHILEKWENWYVLWNEIKEYLRWREVSDRPDLEWHKDALKFEVLLRHAYIITFGFDIKIARCKNESLRPFIIEVNGVYSGCSGAPQNAGKWKWVIDAERRAVLSQVALRAKEADVIGRTSVCPDNRPEVEEFFLGTSQTFSDAIITNPYTIFFSSLQTPDALRDILRYSSDGDQIGKILWEYFTASSGGEPSCSMEVNVFLCQPQGLEEVCDDKILQKDFIPAEFRVPYGVWNEAMSAQYRDPFVYIQSLWHVWCADPALPDFRETWLIVLKTPTWAHGTEVHICHHADKTQILDFLREHPWNCLIEPFIPSIEIDGHRDACARCLYDGILYFTQGVPRVIWVTNNSYLRIPRGSAKDALHTGFDLDDLFRANKTHPNSPALSHPIPLEHRSICAVGVKWFLRHLGQQWRQFDPLITEGARTLENGE